MEFCGIQNIRVYYTTEAANITYTYTSVQISHRHKHQQDICIYDLLLLLLFFCAQGISDTEGEEKN